MYADQPIPLKVTGWRRGFSSLWRKEMGEWWQTRKWLVHLLIWPLMLNGLMILVSYAADLDPTETGSRLQMQLELLLNLGSVAAGIGVTIQMQSSLIGERQSGTAAWILSKPVSRTALILAKFGANAISFLPLAVLIPCAIGYVEIRLFGETPSVSGYLVLTAILMSNALFYLALTLMLGTCFTGRRAVLGTALAILFAGPMLLGFLPQLIWITPFGLPQIGLGLFGFALLPAGYLIPLAATVLWAVLFLMIAVRRFQQEEL